MSYMLPLSICQVGWVMSDQDGGDLGGRQMYLPQGLEVKDPNTLFEIIEGHPFATVVAIGEGQPLVNHLPIVAEKSENGKLTLWGHMAKRNPQWQHFKQKSPVTIAFHGPNAYINPNWYSENDVPTWNYIAVQATGFATVIEDVEGIKSILQKTTDLMNRQHEDQWEFYLPPDLSAEKDITSAIVGFSMVPEKLIGKFKLSQNRILADRKGVIEGLKSRGDDWSRGVREWMLRLTEEK